MTIVKNLVTCSQFQPIKFVFVSLKFVQNLQMKIIYTIICALVCLNTTFAQSSVTSQTVLNTKTQSKQNKEVNQAVPSVSGTEKPTLNDDVIALKETGFPALTNNAVIF